MRTNTNDNFKPTIHNMPETYFERLNRSLLSGLPGFVIAAALFMFPSAPSPDWRAALYDGGVNHAPAGWIMLSILAAPIAIFDGIGFILLSLLHVPARNVEMQRWAERGFYRASFGAPKGYDERKLGGICEHTIKKHRDRHTHATMRQRRK